MTNGGAGRRAIAWTIAVIAATFVAGIAVGISVGGGRPLRSPPPPSGPDVLPQVIQRLEVSEAQRREIDSILEIRRQQTDRMLNGTLSQLRAIVDSTDDEIRAILTGGQRAAFDSLLAVERSRIQMRRRRPAPSTRPDSAR